MTESEQPDAPQPDAPQPARGRAVPAGPPDRRTVRRWQRYLADERAEAAVYRRLAERRTGPDRDILLELADAEGRHAAHWSELLEAHRDVAGSARPHRGSLQTRLLVFLARYFGTVFVLALAQRAEGRSPYARDVYATETMAADEQVHGEVVRALAVRGRNRLSGNFRAAVFGANDGLVSNLALVLGIGAAGASSKVVLLTGLAGLLAGALSMGAGEYVSVRSQRELLEASMPDPTAAGALPHLDIEANELALVYRARGMREVEAEAHSREVLSGLRAWHGATDAAAEADTTDEHETLGKAWHVAVSSFLFFASGAVIPVLPYAFGVGGYSAQIAAAVLVGAALLLTGAVVGLLSGASPVSRAFRQLAIGYGAAAATYLLGLGFGI